MVAITIILKCQRSHRSISEVTLVYLHFRTIHLNPQIQQQQEGTRLPPQWQDTCPPEQWTMDIHTTIIPMECIPPIILWLIQQSTLRLQPWTIWWTILTIWWIISTQCSPSPLLLQHPTLYASSIPSWRDSYLNKNSLLQRLMCVIVAIKLATGFNSVL